MLERWLLVWLVLLGLLAYFWPALAPGIVDPWAVTNPALSAFFCAAMLAIGSLLPRDEIAQVARRWPTVAAGTLLQYTSMPLLAWLAARAFGLEGPLLVGVIMAGCVPGAMASNVLTLLARGNVSYSVSLTTLATLVSPLTVPLALWLTLGQAASFSAGSLIVQLCWTVVLPVLVGYGLSRRWPAWQRAARRFGPSAAHLAILWIIASVVAVNRQRLHEIDPRLFASLLSLNLGGYLAGYGGAMLLRLPAPMRRALTIEIGMQNAGLGTVLASQLFADPATQIAPAIYTFGCMLTGTILAGVWSRIPVVSTPTADAPDRSHAAFDAAMASSAADERADEDATAGRAATLDEAAGD